MKRVLGTIAAALLVVLPLNAKSQNVDFGINGGQATLGANTFAGAQVAPSLALGGATIGSNALAVTGNAVFNTAVTVSPAGLFINSAGAAYIALNGRAHGDIVAFSTGRIGFTLSSTNANGAAPDAYITRDGVGALSMRDGTTAQTFRLYNTYTDASNYERASLSWSANKFTINGGDALGTGTARDLSLLGGGTSLDVTSTVINMFRNGTSNSSLFNASGTSLTSTAQNFFRLTPTINQASGTYNVLDINPTETSIGAGPHYLIQGRIGGGGNVFSVDRAGGVIAAYSVNTTRFLVNSNGYLSWSSRAQMVSPSDGVITLYNNAAGDFTMLQFGGTTSSFPAWKRASATLQARLADDSGSAFIRAAGLTVDSGTVMISSSTAFANGAAAAVGTLTNAPAAGNPTKWVAINDSGTTRYIPAW